MFTTLERYQKKATKQHTNLHGKNWHYFSYVGDCFISHEIRISKFFFRGSWKWSNFDRSEVGDFILFFKQLRKIRSHIPEDLVIQIASISQALGICFTRLGGFKHLLNARPETHPGVSWSILTFAYYLHSWVETQPPTNCYNQLAGLHSPNISLVPKDGGLNLNLKCSAIFGGGETPLHKL